MATSTLQVLIDIKSKLAGLEQGVEQMRRLRAETQNVSRAGSALSGVFAGIAAGATIQLTQQLQRIPQIITQSVRDGIGFNATIESARIGIASIIKSFDGSGKFQNFDAALSESARAVDFLKSKAVETQATFEELLVGYQAAAGPAFAAGINSTREQITLTVALSQAMSALTIPAREMSQEIRGVFEGDTGRQSRLNQVLGITKEEMEKASRAGTAYQLVMGRLNAFMEGAKRGQETYNVLLSNTQDLLLQLKAAATVDVFSTLRDSLKDLNAELAKPQAIDFARGVGAVIDQEVRGIFILVRALGDLMNDLSKIPGGSLLFLGPLGQEISKTFNEGAAQSFVERHTQILQRLREETAATQTMVELGGQNVEIEKQRKALHDEIALILEHVNERTGKLTLEEIKLGEAAAKFADEFDRLPGTATTVLDKIRATAEQMERIAKAGAALAKADAQIAILAAQNRGDALGAFNRRKGEETLALYTSLQRPGESDRFALERANALGIELQKKFDLEQKTKRETEATAALHLRISNLLRQQQTTIEGVRQQQDLISQNPFLSLSEKNAQLLALMRLEISTLNGEVAKGQALLTGGTLDADTYEQVRQKVQEARSEMELLLQKTSALSFSGGLQENLLSWVNSMGTAAQQVGQAITSSIGTAIDATANALTGLIFQTRSWQQTVLQAGQSIVSTLIKIGLQMVVQKVLGSLLTRAGTQEQTQANAQVLASATPAAVAQSGATSGSNWVIAAIAAGVAIAAIIALLSGFEGGGHTGFGGTSQIAGVVHGQEFVQPKGAVKYYGLDVMEAVRQRQIPAEQLRAMIGNYRYRVTPRLGSFEMGGAVASITESVASNESSRAPAVAETKLSNYLVLDPTKLRRMIVEDGADEIWVTDMRSNVSYKVHGRKR